MGMRCGVFFSTLVDRWNFVPVGADDTFQVETAYMRRHILIPVSEFLGEDALGRVVEALRTIQRELITT